MSVATNPLWRDTNRRIFRPTVERAAQDLGISALAVEKDYWVCEALRAIEAARPGIIVFKGGTSLEKMGIIARFSEDLDLIVTGSIGGSSAAPKFLKSLCEAARTATGGELSRGQASGKAALAGKAATVGKPAVEPREGTLGYKVDLSIPVTFSPPAGSAVADPTSIQLELGQSTGHDPSDPRQVTSLMARALSRTVDVSPYPDLAGFSVRMLHPGRTLLEKLLRVNTFACMPADARKDHYWTRIGRQYYDIWALLSRQEVLDFFERDDLSDIIADCLVQSIRFGGDSPIPDGGFAASPAFDRDADVIPRLRVEHANAMRDLYYGTDGGPTFDAVLARVSEHSVLLDVS